MLDHGGEVLKFMGDGLLAIFPIASESDAGAVCRRALSCAQEFRKRIAELPPPAENEAPIRFGLALHVGEVMYGNIGGGNRLDFTCIGPAVNLAARLEKVAAKLGEAIVASAEFAGHFPDDFGGSASTRSPVLPHRKQCSAWPTSPSRARPRALLRGRADDYM